MQDKINWNLVTRLQYQQDIYSQKSHFPTDCHKRYIFQEFIRRYYSLQFSCFRQIEILETPLRKIYTTYHHSFHHLVRKLVSPLYIFWSVFLFAFKVTVLINFRQGQDCFFQQFLIIQAREYSVYNIFLRGETVLIIVIIYELK